MRTTIGVFLWAITMVASAADQVPALRKGMWDLKQNINGRPYNTRKCMGPYAELIRQHTALTESGCSFQTSTKSATQFEIRSKCIKRDPAGRRWESDSVSILTVQSDTSYQLDVRGTTNTVPMQESVQGRWVGTCSE